MNAWMNPWWNLFKSPLSGDVTQAISPVTSWWSPQVEFNFAGNKNIESEVVSNIASYGKQIGVLTDVVLELSQDSDSPAVKQLHAIAKDIEAVKTKHLAETVESLKIKLLKLKGEQPEAFEQLISGIEKK